MEWISVKERLPEQGQWVMCALSGGSLCPVFVGGLPFSKYVTHWMPYPEPPKNEQYDSCTCGHYRCEHLELKDDTECGNFGCPCKKFSERTEIQ
jgi:hypothetical protein